jgi:hypothetical protein
MAALLNDLRKTALIAGIAMAASSVWSLAGQVVWQAVRPGLISPEGIAVTLAILPFDLCLPALLLMLYRSGAEPVLSSNFRNLAFALALIRGLRLAVFAWTTWSQGLHPNAGISAGGFYLSSSNVIISDTLELASIAGFILFLVALSRQTGVAESRNFRGLELVKKLALVAAAVGTMSLVAVIVAGVWMHSMQQRGIVHSSTTVASIARGALFSLPALIAPLMIYAGIRRVPVTVPEG